jgi:methyl-accepting chemotaxis protein
LSALSVVVSIGAAASLMQQRMFNDRIEKLRAFVESTVGIAQSLENRVVSHQFTREQALTLLRDDVHDIRFDGGGGYVYAQTLDNMVILHGANPAMEGNPAPASTVNEHGRPITDLIQDALRSSNNGVVAYLFPKPGHTELSEKVSYVARFAPWDLVFVAGAYVDDLDVTFHATLLRLTLIGGIIVAATILVGWLINRDITISLGGLKGRDGAIGERRPRDRDSRCRPARRGRRHVRVCASVQGTHRKGGKPSRRAGGRPSAFCGREADRAGWYGGNNRGRDRQRRCKR